VQAGHRPHRAGAIEEIVEMMDAAAPKPGRPKTNKKARWPCHTKKGALIRGKEQAPKQ